MITVTPAAAAQIRVASHQGKMEGLPLRLAARRDGEGHFEYGMGFDDTGRADDMRFTSEGIEITVGATSIDLLSGTVIDFVEMEPGDFRFIFINPNDPEHTTPASGAGGQGDPTP